MFKITVLILIFSVLIHTNSRAQENTDSLLFRQTLKKGDDCYNRNAYDSAFTFYNEAYTTAKGKKALADYYSISSCLLYMGHSCFKQKLYKEAHKYYYASLLNARKYTHHYQVKNNALRALNLLHAYIKEKDITFPYPVISEFSEQNVFFTVDKVLFQKGDSAVIEINAGTYDGVVKEKNNGADLFSVTDEASGQDWNYKGTVKLITVNANKIIASVSLQKSTAIISPGWQVKLKVNTPQTVTNSGLESAYLLNFKWLNREKVLNIFNQRFAYYYTDKELEVDIMDLLREELNEVVKKLAPDTLTGTEIMKTPAKDGIFKGKNPIAALNTSNVNTINYFFHYISDNYKTYSGRLLMFSEIYATWAIYGAPLTKSDLKTYILGDKKTNEGMVQRTVLVKKQAEEENLSSLWVDEGLRLIDKSYWLDLTYQYRLLYNYGIATNREDCKGWSNFLQAVKENDYGYSKRRDSLLNTAYQHFQTAGSEEGIKWIESTKQSLVDSAVVTLNIQRIHSSNYEIFASPNQRYFASAGDDYTIKIWDINLGKQIHSIDAHSAEIYNLDFNPGGRYLASLSADSSIKIWNTFTYQLMSSFMPPSQQRYIKFSPDGKYLVSSGFDSTINYWEPFTGKLVRSFRSPGGFARSISFLPKYTESIYLLCTDSAIYKYSLDTLQYTQMIKSNEQSIISLLFSNNGQYLCYTKTDSTVSIWDMETGNFVFSDKIYVRKSSASQYYSDGAFSPDSRYFLFCRDDSNTVFLDLQQRKTVGLWELPVDQYVFNGNGNYYITHGILNPSIVDFSEFDWQKIYDNASNANTDFKNWKETYFSLNRKEFNINSQSLVETRFSHDDRSIIYLTWETHKLDLANGKSEMIFPDHHWMSGNHQYPENEEIVLYKKFNFEDTVFIINSKGRAILAELSLPDKEKITSFCFYGNDRFCALVGNNGSLAVWNVPEKRMLYVGKINNGHSTSFHSMLQQPGTNKMIVYGNKQKPLIINIDNQKLLDSIDFEKPDLIAVGASNLFFTNNRGLFKIDPDSYKIIDSSLFKTSDTYIKNIKISNDGKYIYLLKEPYVFVIATKNLKIISQFTVPVKNLTSLAVSHNDSMLSVVSTNGQFLLYKPLTGQLLSNIYLSSDKDAILMDSVGHYIASKEALQSLVFNKGYKSFNYDQFDLQLNQPHKVLSAIAVADTNTIQAYEKAYLKRLARNGVTGDVIEKGTAPSIIVLNRGNIRPTTSQEFYTIRVECYDNKNKLSSLKVFVNDVPVADSNGQWSSLDTTSQIFDIDIPLTSGNNKVKIYCVNKSGLSSYKEMFDIKCTAKDQKQDTYFIGLGVNLYADKANNLTYSAKDIRDLALSFKKLYPDIIIDTLINSKVTLKNIELLKQRMKKIKVTDRVIMAVTGHGLLSDSLDFYYATYDVDFNHPDAKGLKYQELEGILSNTKARQKLLLIDACHSGMLDKEAIVKAKEQVFTNDTGTGTVKVKGARGIDLGQAPKLDETNSFNLMQNLFADFSNENGIVVISAAGGLEYAFESKQWKNGVFTYCILKGLMEKEADKESEGGNGNGKVSVQELMRYVSSKVPELTGGMQQPTSRRENLDFDWIIK